MCFSQITQSSYRCPTTPQSANYFHQDDSPQAGGLACKRAGSPLTQDEQPAKRGRIGIAGGKAATTKPISQDGYDTDDARIIALKQQGYSDERVAHMLIHEGRVRYVPKTVGSRWLRLRKVQAQHDEDKLDDELSDWHIGDVRISSCACTHTSFIANAIAPG